MSVFLHRVGLLKPAAGGGTPQDTGFVIAGAGATVNTGSGPSWSNPGNITADDGSEASISQASANPSDTLRASSFGLSVPGGATIDGIEIQVEIRSPTVEDGIVSYINVGKDDSTLGTPLTPAQSFGSTSALLTFGGSTSLFGLSWTAAEVNASTFQALLRCNPEPNFGIIDAFIDAMWIKVYYTA